MPVTGSPKVPSCCTRATAISTTQAARRSCWAYSLLTHQPTSTASRALRRALRMGAWTVISSTSMRVVILALVCWIPGPRTHCRSHRPSGPMIPVRGRDRLVTHHMTGQLGRLQLELGASDLRVQFGRPGAIAPGITRGPHKETARGFLPRRSAKLSSN